ncbi:MAG TPA: hypothetical protein VM100_11405 [Longimicrobiales bacterium]|nr:hypothetical protein [Longimicrobiales bacterium]
MRQNKVFGLFLMAILATAACAHESADTSTQANVQSQPGQLDIDVTNNLIPPGPVYVYLVPSSGIERDLGTVFGGTHRVTYRGFPLRGNYQFVARSGSRTIASTVLVLTNVLGLRWDLERNRIEVTRVVE